MKNLFVIFILLLCFGLSSCRQSTAPVIREKSIIAYDNNVFAFKLFKEINSEDNAKNLFISPFSVSIALGMTNNGAVGTTRDAMFKTLEQNGMTIDSINNMYLGLQNTVAGLDQAVQFNIANSIWYKNTFTFEPTFFDICSKYFNSAATPLDFNNPASVDIINNWISNKTNGTIQNVIASIDPSTIMFIINALYFKAPWTVKFDSTKSYIGDFYKTTDASIKCKMMLKGDSLMCYENSEFQLAELPYGNSSYSMLVFLPKSGQNIDNFISEMNEGNWYNWINGLQLNKAILTMPKFKFEYKNSLKQSLTTLGMGNAFDKSADFTNLSKLPGVYIGDVIHQAHIDVSEDGTVASAVTVVDIRNGTTSEHTPENVFIITIDHPFVFVIMDKFTKSIEFMGKVLEPVY